MSLTHQTRSAFVVRPLFLGHHQGPDFFFYFFSFSGQGCTGNYKSIEAWPGLYNLYGICVLLCESSLREWPPLSVLLWRLGFFCSAFLFPANHFLWENLAVKECSTCTSVLENLTKADHQLFLPIFQKYFTLSTLSWCMFLFLNSFKTVAESWTTSSSVSCTLAPQAPLCFVCLFPLPTVHCFYSCEVVVNKAFPLAPSFLWSPPLYWGKNCGSAM